MFEVIKRNGLARTGSWEIETQKNKVTTPNIFFIEKEGILAHEQTEILISEKEASSNKPYIISSESLFGKSQEKINDHTISPALFYPPSQLELNVKASRLNKKNLQSKIFTVTGSEDQVANASYKIEAEVFVLSNALQLMRNPSRFVNTLITLRKTIGYHKMIYTPGLGKPQHLAILAYSGVDLFDSVPLILNARMENYLTTEGKIKINEFEEDFCFCPSCINKKRDYESILLHNYLAAISELKMVRNTIRKGQLRELVESRIRTEPNLVSILRILDMRFHSFMETYFPVTGGPMIAASNDSLYRPEVIRFRERLKERYEKPSHPKVLLLIPCSAKKPYSFSKTHKAFRRAVSQCGNSSAVHEVIITSPLGIVPRELELFYPAQQYDIPVTHSWSRDEMSMIGEDLSEFLKTNCYDRIIAHLPFDYMFCGDYVNELTNTCSERPTSQTSLKKLKDILSEAVSPYKKLNEKNRKKEAMSSFSQFQFGKAADALAKGSDIKGRYPNLKIFKDGKQLGMLVGNRGLISLTLEGAKIFGKQNAYWVRIDDFTPKGNIFAVGVLDADSDIRVGDDVVVLRNDELVGVGVAQMSPNEMKESQRGEAVRIRHLVKSG
jgi:archaeosine synthase